MDANSIETSTSSFEGNPFAVAFSNPDTTPLLEDGEAGGGNTGSGAVDGGNTTIGDPALDLITAAPPALDPTTEADLDPTAELPLPPAAPPPGCNNR